MGKTRRSKSKRLRRKRTLKRGGAQNTPPRINCTAEGMDLEMREAAFGQGYRIGVGGVHDDGEQWSYDETARRILGGMIDWYRRTLEDRGVITPYTQEELQALNDNPILKDLGVFFNRYKIVAEKLPLAKRYFTRGVRSIFTDVPFDDSYEGPASFGKLARNLQQRGSLFFVNGLDGKTVRLNRLVKQSLDILVSFEDIDFGAKDLPIESAIDKVQCIIFYIVKHKGQLPPGFVMDERITRRAHEELRMSTPYDVLVLNNPISNNARLVAVEKWLSFLNDSFDELSNPYVTFGLEWD
jgi:hypothetical protein